MSEYLKLIRNFLNKHPSTSYWVCIYLIIDRNYLNGFITEIPFHTHEWAQADRCSIAQAFAFYGNSIWDPSTLNLASFKGKVGVELPLVAYITGLIGRFSRPEYIFGSFRIINLMICALGGWYLFKLIFEQTKSIILALNGSVVLFFSVNFLFYACNFLSDAPAASLILASFYYFVKWYDSKQLKYLLFFMCFAVVANLLKMSTISYSIAMLLIVGFDLYQNKKWKQFIIIGTFISPIIIQYLWIRHRINTYNSPIFLSSTKHFESVEQLNQIIRIFREYFLNHYMPISISLIWLSTIVSTFFLRIEEQKKSFFKNLSNYYFLIGIMSLFVLLFFFLFGRQFDVHDYYFISIFTPLILITWSSSIIFLNNEYKIGNNKHILIGISVFMLLTYAIVEHKFFKYIRSYKPTIHYQEWIERTDKNYGLKIIEQIGVQKNEPIFIVNDGTPNLSLSRFNHIGFSKSYEKKGSYIRELIIDMKKSNSKLAFINKSEYHQCKLNFDSMFTHIVTKNELTVLRLKSSTKPQPDPSR